MKAKTGLRVRNQKCDFWSDFPPEDLFSLSWSHISIFKITISIVNSLNFHLSTFLCFSSQRKHFSFSLAHISHPRDFYVFSLSSLKYFFLSFPFSSHPSLLLSCFSPFSNKEWTHQLHHNTAPQMTKVIMELKLYRNWITSSWLTFFFSVTVFFLFLCLDSNFNLILKILQ